MAEPLSRNVQIFISQGLMGPYGIHALNTSSTPPRRTQSRASSAVRKVIPFPLFCPLRGASAELANQLVSVNEGHLRRIFVLFPLIRNVKISTIISRLRASLGLKNVVFSVRSVKRTRILVSASYCKDPIPSGPSEPTVPKAA